MILQKIAKMVMAVAVLSGVVQVAAAAGIIPSALRTEYLVDPLGIDTEKPQLMWEVRAVDPQARGVRQNAYRILVASSLERLSPDKADLWDSGKVVSDETVGIEYAGKPLRSRDRCFWRVRVWDGADEASEWSDPAHWTMGLLKREDWQAKWIAAPLPPGSIRPQHAGFRSEMASTADAVKWVHVDLGSVCKVDRVVLHPAFPVFQEKARRSADYLFPVRFKIEISTKDDFSDAITVIDRSGVDVQRPNKQPLELVFPAREARHVRLIATRLSKHVSRPGFALALAEMEVFSGTENVALRAKVGASDSLEEVDKGWAIGNLTDGQIQPDGGTLLRLHPAPLFRKEFVAADKPVHRATLIATALGIYVASINGKRVSGDWFAPGWNQYDKRTRYQTYDVTNLIRPGENVAGVVLGDGWYRRRPVLGGYSRQLNLEYAGQEYECDAILRFLAQIEVEYADGTRQVIPTNGSWQTYADGPVQKTRMFEGVDYDARKELPGWDGPGFRGSAGWASAEERPPVTPLAFSAQMNPPIRVIDEWKPSQVREIRSGTFLFSFPQHVTGVCRLKLHAPAGTVVNIRHGQALNPDGSLMTTNLIGAVDNRDLYICRGSGTETFVPEFAYHGFQYVEVSGVKDAGAIKELTALALADDIPQILHFQSSDTRLNKLWSNLVRTYYDNFKSGITDACARDERGAFQTASTVPTYAAIFDGASFSRKLLEDLRDAQLPNDLFAVHSPANKMSKAYAPLSSANTFNLWYPWAFYAQDPLLKENYEAFRRFLHAVLRNCSRGIWEPVITSCVNDWLDAYMSDPPGQKNTPLLWDLARPHPYLPAGLIRTAYLYRCCQMMAEMAVALGKTEDAAEYVAWTEKIRAAFGKQFVKEDGTVTGDIQASYALALGFDLIASPELQRKASARLVQTVEAFHNGHISTGVRAAHALLEALSRHGHHDLAYRLVMQSSYPSYGYMVDQGATTVWERWDGFISGRGYRSDLSHSESLLFGQWIIENIIGLRVDSTQPGFKHFRIAPKPAKDLDWVKGSYDSVRGTIAVEWKRVGGGITLNCTVPPNTTAEVWIPAGRVDAVTERGRPLAMAKGVMFLRMSEGHAVCTVVSGSYQFEAK